MKEMDPEAIQAFLKSQTIGHLGTIGPEYPYVVPIAFLYHPPNILFATQEGQKTEHIREHPKVCFEVSDVVPELGIYRSVVALGRAEILEDPEACTCIVDELTTRFERQGPRWLKRKDYPARAMSRREEGCLQVVTIHVDNITGLDYEVMP